MSYLNFKSEYDKYPNTKIYGQKDNVFEGYDELILVLKKFLKDKKKIAIEMYPGVDKEYFSKQLISKLDVEVLVDIEKYAKPINEIDEMLKRNITEDRVFGLMSHHVIDDFYDEEVIKVVENEIEDKQSIIYGFGATLIKNYDALIYVDITRWEIQLRYRNKMSNFLCDNPNLDVLRKYKRAYFIEWRVADRLKKKIFNKIDYYLDSNETKTPKMITKQVLDLGLETISKNPFRLVPYFDPGVWGGQWMKEVCNLDPEKSNYAWSFDGVPEENAVSLDIDGVIFTMPAINVVFFEAINLLGNKVHSRFGTEFPIRFDFLDTMNGGNLSLQVHPLTEYIQEQFGMHYTQDESYYILDAKDDAVVYLGCKSGINKDEMLQNLYDAQDGLCAFDDEKYINKFSAKKHDHFLIPAGTIHCSGKNAMVLEISATPYIFTFKLWDWGRLGLDLLPRPVHISHGSNVIQFDRNTEYAKKHLINNIQKISDVEEKTGLHEREFIETRRFFFDDEVIIENHDSVNMCNLIEGQKAIILPINNEFTPLEIHYAETFIIPEYVKRFRIKNLTPTKKCGVIQAYVR